MRAQWEHRNRGAGALARETPDPSAWRMWGAAKTLRADLGPAAFDIVLDAGALAQAAYPHPTGWLLGVHGSAECEVGDALIFQVRITIGSGSAAYEWDVDALTLGVGAGDYRPRIVQLGPLPAETIAVRGRVHVLMGDLAAHTIGCTIGAWVAPQVWEAH